MGGGPARKGTWWAACFAVLAVAGCDEDRRVRTAVGELAPDTWRLGFGATTLGVPVEREVLLSQRGLLAAEVTGLRIEPDEGAYTTSELAGIVQRDASARLHVRYRPVRAARHQAQLVLELLDGAPVRIALDGEGVDARARPEVPVVLGRPAIGAVRRRTLTLRNDAKTAVPVRLAARGRDAAELTLPATALLAPFGEVQLPLTWEPQGAAGVRDLWIELTACPICAPERVEVVAEAVPTPLVVTPDPVHAGGVGIDSERKIEVTITNATDELIDLTDIRLGDGTDPAWTLEAAPGPLPPLFSTRALLTCTPTHLGLAAGTLVIASDAEPPGDRVVPIDANGGGAQLVLTPPRLAFRPTAAFSRSELTLQITNGGADLAQAPLRMDGLELSGDDFRLVTTVPPGTLLQAGESAVVRVAFLPQRTGQSTGVLVVRSDDAASPAAEVPLSGIGLDAADCRLQVTPPALDWGSVRPGRAATLVTRVANVGAEPCAIWDASIEGDPAFTITRPRSFVAVPAGLAVNIPVRFTPANGQPASAILKLQTNDARAPIIDVPLAGGSLQACLRADPGFVDFGPRRMDCGPAERTVTWRNDCTAPIDVREVFMGAAPDETFSLLAAPQVPLLLGPGDTIEAKVRFTPTNVGWTARPFFAQAEGDALPILLVATADVSDVADHAETFVQPTPGKVDVLFVVDNTASMADERAGLARGVAGFLSAAEARGIDYQVGVTTTGVGLPQAGASSGTCAGGANGAENGRLYPVDGTRPRVVTRSTPNRADVLAANLDVGGCHNVEQGLEAARRALSSPLSTNADDPGSPEPRDGNLGLLRTDAALAVVVVSDEDDESPGSLKDRIRALRRVKPATPMSFSAVVAPAGGCATAVEPGTAYLEAVREIGGVTANICDDWSRSLDTLADDFFGARPRTRFVLAAHADPATLVVLLNGAPATGWRYDAGAHAIEFDVEPAPASRLDVRYREPCP